MTLATSSIGAQRSAFGIINRLARGTVLFSRAWTIPLLAAGGLFLPPATRGQDDPAQKRPARRARAAAERDQPRQLIVRVYPIEDLLLTVADYPYRGGLPGASQGEHPTMGGAGGGMGGGGGGGMFSVPSAAGPPQVLRQVGGAGSGNIAVRAQLREIRQQESQELMEMIKSYVNELDSVDGVCSIFRGSLIVQNTAEVHKKVADLLQAVRATSDVGRSVTVDATWLVLTPQQLETLRRMASLKPHAPVAELRKSFEELSQQATAIHGHIACLNGQQVHIATGRRQVISSGATPTVGVGAAGYAPIISVLNLGAVLQVTPSFSGEGGKAIVDLHSVVTQWKEPAAPIQIASQVLAGSEEKKSEGPLVHTLVTIDRADIGAQEWSSTVSIPIGQPVYVGSVTLSGDKAGQLEPAQNPELALVIEVRAN